MFFTKYPHASNFSFGHSFCKREGSFTAGARDFKCHVESFEGEVFHIRMEGAWDRNLSLSPLDVPPSADSDRVEITPELGFSLTGSQGKALLGGDASAFFGVSGEATLFQFTLGGPARFYGMGEKTFNRVELSGYRAKFWNTDVWSDFHYAQWNEHPTDPPYFSTPLLIARIGEEYVGLLLHNPHPCWMETPGTDESRVFVEWQRTSSKLILGSEGGEPNLWIAYGPTLPEVVRKLQKLVGVTPLPPLWSLGYQQSRWGYGGHEDLLDLDAKFEAHGIPCSGLWLDLDYMTGYRIFKTNPEMFPKGAGVTAAALAKNGRRIVPIIDPGVKKEPGYSVYDDGLAHDAFCKNSEGNPFVGMVWPGETVFPDFSQARVRNWWAGYAADFRREGFGACWVDMNDPSTGPVDPSGMLFENGRLPHAAHHNDYALGMQMATRDGFLAAQPNERPFILSRSGYTGSSRYSAVWTGDNVSNRFYLGLTIPTAIGMSLSGLPFSGPDLGGFGDDCSDELMADWVRAGFLFPFCRNHSTAGTRPQEPWGFKKPTLEVMRRYIRLRYRLLPYLYNLFAEQEESGDPILRPLFYHYDDEELDQLIDQFMIGPSILQAPFVSNASTRSVVLPGQAPWFDASIGRWVEPGAHVVARTRFGTPLYFANGAIVPMRGGPVAATDTDLRQVVFHLFVNPNWTGETVYRYRADDGLTFGYLDGQRSEMFVTVSGKDGALELETEMISSGFGKIKPRLIVHGGAQIAKWNGLPASGRDRSIRLAGRTYAVQEAILD